MPISPEEMQEQLAKLTSSDQKVDWGSIRDGIEDVVALERRQAILEAGISALGILAQVDALTQLVGSKLDMQAMTALNDTSLNDAERSEALTRAMYSLLGEHHLLFVRLKQLLEPLHVFAEQIIAAANATDGIKKTAESATD